MPWSNVQKAHFVRACTAVGINDGQRRMILGQCEQRAVYKGRQTSTSPKLTQADYEHCMAVVERMGGGQIQIRDKSGRLVYSQGRFDNQDEGHARRLRHIARQLAGRIFAGDDQDHLHQLDSWIDSRVKGGKCRKLDDLTVDQLQDLLHGLKAFARRNHINLTDDARTPVQRVRDTQRRHGRSSSPSKQGCNNAHTAITPGEIPF